jgi:uncharacterized membrane protein YfcA
MDILNISLPISGIEVNLIVLVILGFCVGTLGGFFGVGAAWISAPALNILGLSMPFSIGTNLSLIFGKSLIAARKHGKRGNIDWRLAAISVFGSIVGVEGGKRLLLLLDRADIAGAVVRWTYMVFLFGLGFYMLYDYYSSLERYRKRENPNPSSAPDNAQANPPGTTGLRFRDLSLPPMISLPASGVDKISFWMISVIFIFAGFLSGFIGIGGGFIVLPALIYLVGCATAVAVGTTLLCVCVITGYGCFTYSFSGLTEPITAIIMLICAAIGAQFGNLATRFVRGYGIRLLFSTMIILAGVSVALKQIQTSAGIEVLETVASSLLLGSAGAMTLIIIVKLLTGFRKQR